MLQLPSGYLGIGIGSSPIGNEGFAHPQES